MFVQATPPHPKKWGDTSPPPSPPRDLRQWCWDLLPEYSPVHDRKSSVFTWFILPESLDLFGPKIASWNIRGGGEGSR